MTFYQKQPTKSKHFAVECSAYDSVRQQKYESSSPCRLSMARSHGQYQRRDHLETTRIERAFWNMSDSF